MSSGRVLCQVCRRFIPLRNDGRVRAHVAAYGKRGKCEGSAMFSVGVEMAMQDAEQRAAEHSHLAHGSWDDLTPAQRFNARDEWAKVDALYFEYEDMRLARGASYEALMETYEALERAIADAKALAPWHVVAPDPEAT